MVELYRNDPALALDVINNILDDDGQAELSTVLRQLKLAFGGEGTRPRLSVQPLDPSEPPRTM